MAYEELLQPEIKARGHSSIAPPPGFGSQLSSKAKPVEPVKKPTPAELDKLKLKKAWDIASGPAKSVPMNCFMSYMTGNSLQMIPIMMTVMLLLNPIKAIFLETNKAFASLETRNASDLLLPKAAFVVFQLANAGIGLFKLWRMGLIPNGEADWLGWKEVTQVVEKLRT
ncbi:hypothetical protein FT663_01076 [Candidozyma haemuli var. vulneris]|uniref:ER membrane protein complex subunit 4 n=1 Tax=Candidozyma haemuli TaxID=45357 RepID=A0A2V1AVX2_9ASCO|nr:hypothetical protein CXQ85_000453 [[Candida] haemuloni]KAF3986104.1 hypothetical protein FT662_04761 [[Candida] haemuloni var. vulneris]KAF3994846.1 hypothetical protein FT663_01076 [[Candida] haemuloni var. vulneris]PVH21473.1 hypothetical protein CXQ85_000453 [[Candida] haemuloni]